MTRPPPAIGRALALALPALASLGLAGCDREPHPWEQGGTGEPAPAPSPIRSSLAPSGSGVSAATSAEDPVLPVPVGGAWVSCYGHFKPSGEPRKDVKRLGLLCGPSNGMKQEGDALEGSVSEGAAPVERKIEAERGACYRVFAVGEASITDLDVTLRSSRNSAIAQDHGQDAWPIVQPDRPICALEDDRWTVEVRSKKGRGRFAAEVWSLAKPARH